MLAGLTSRVLSNVGIRYLGRDTEVLEGHEEADGIGLLFMNLSISGLNVSEVRQELCGLKR